MSESRDDTRLMDSGDDDSQRVSGGARVVLENLVGRTLDERYIVDELIGQGAMGAVFRARQTRLRRTVALKVPKPELCTMPEFVGRFEREALSMARLVHQNIVQVFDVCVSDDPDEPTFIVMEYVEGVELEKFIRSQERDLTVAALLEIFRQIAQGLDVAHERGIVHRDIKPSNIVITMPQRVPKIMDFGVAKLALEDAFETTESKAIGTPAYMAPEQVQGKDVTPAADLYAFAVMIYRLLTRALPYDATTSSALLFAHVSEKAIDPSARNPGLPRAFDTVMQKALAKDPADRHEDALALIQAVERALEPTQGRQLADLLAHASICADLEVTQTDETAIPSPAELPPPWFRRPLALIAGGAAGLLILALGLARLSGDEKPAPQSTDGPAVVASAEPTPVPEPTAIPPKPAPEATPTSRPEPTPAATPRPTATPRPARKTPAPTPALTMAPTADEPDIWDPELFPPDIDYFAHRKNQEAIDAMFAAQIGDPMSEGHFDAADNALARLDGETAAQILREVKSVYPDYAELFAKFRAAPDSVYWEERAAIRLDVNIYGRPKTIRDRSYRRSILKTEEPLAARVVLTEDGWKLTSLTGEVPKANR
ncbi:protein kinase [bacterium]|nr:protein kinase [bacterium]